MRLWGKGEWRRFIFCVQIKKQMWCVRSVENGLPAEAPGPLDANKPTVTSTSPGCPVPENQLPKCCCASGGSNGSADLQCNGTEDMREAASMMYWRWLSIWCVTTKPHCTEQYTQYNNLPLAECSGSMWEPFFTIHRSGCFYHFAGKIRCLPLKELLKWKTLSPLAASLHPTPASSSWRSWHLSILLTLVFHPLLLSVSGFPALSCLPSHVLCTSTVSLVSSIALGRCTWNQVHESNYSIYSYIYVLAERSSLRLQQWDIWWPLKLLLLVEGGRWGNGKRGGRVNFSWDVKINKLPLFIAKWVNVLINRTNWDACI